MGLTPTKLYNGELCQKAAFILNYGLNGFHPQNQECRIKCDPLTPPFGDKWYRAVSAETNIFVATGQNLNI